MRTRFCEETLDIRTPLGTSLTWTSRNAPLYRIAQRTNFTAWSFSSLFALDAGTQTTRVVGLRLTGASAAGTGIDEVWHWSCGAG